MKLFRYRRPSVNRVLGVTAAKRRVRRAAGISQVEAWATPTRVKQRVKQRAGLYASTARAVRQTSRGKLPSVFGLRSRKRR